MKIYTNLLLGDIILKNDCDVRKWQNNLGHLWVFPQRSWIRNEGTYKTLDSILFKTRLIFPFPNTLSPLPFAIDTWECLENFSKLWSLEHWFVMWSVAPESMTHKSCNLFKFRAVWRALMILYLSSTRRFSYCQPRTHQTFLTVSLKFPSLELEAP